MHASGKSLWRWYLVLVIGFTTGSPATARITLPALVADSMVLQRDVPLRIWGWGSPGEKVRISFRGTRYSAKTQEDGKWRVTLTPMGAGGPFSMEIVGNNRIELNDILVGDVWVCSGQSNMVHYLDLHKERYAKEVASANNRNIRQLLIPTSTELLGPLSDLREPVAWKSATRQNILRFSVVAYFFAKSLYEKYHVPIGLINASVGGTPIEAWTSARGLQAFPALTKTIETNKDTAYVNGINREARDARLELTRKRSADLGTDGPVKWYDMDFTPKGWHVINIPGYWEDQGVADLDGVMWYRREFDLPAAYAGEPGMVALGRIVDADILFINGQKVGQTTYQYPQRRYLIPAGLLRTGKNTFVVRVTNFAGKGGFVPDKPYNLYVGGDTIDLKGYWLCKVGAVFDHADPIRSIPQQNQPATLYNGMIAPLTGFSIKGVIWYQGESNADRPENYRALMHAIVRDWRANWENKDLPFLYVQLPNFMDRRVMPSESQWALIREAQLQTLDLPNTAMVVAIDLGEWNDIHPDNKKPIGDRLALAARKVAYGEPDIVYSGPIYQSYKIENDRVIVSFDHVGSGLMAAGGKALRQFAIAGADKRFVWANASIEGDKVVVWSEEVSNPKYVRYAWSDNPDGANLYNKEGLPASPFRTDP